MKRAVFLILVLLIVISLPAMAQGKTLVIAGGVDIESTNIFRATASPSFSVLGHIYETLFSISPEGVLEPVLAESIEATGDTTYEIKLREGVSFTDGTPFNAEAAKASLDYVLNPDNAAPFRFLIVVAGEPIQVEVADEYTLQITTPIPFAPLPAHLSHSSLGMVSPAALEQGEDFLSSNAIGTGPFVLEAWDRAEQVVLARNENYWGDAPALDTVVFRVIPEAGTRVVEIESGTVDVAVRIPPADIPLLEMNPDVEVVITPALRTIYIFFNVTEEPFTDVRVRQAFNYAVDSQAIVDALFEGNSRASDAPIAPAVFGYSAQTPYSYDPDRARELLAEAGIEPGTSVVLYHPTERYPQDALVADAVRAQLADVGVNVELRTLEWVQYVPHVRRTKADGNDIQFAMLGWGTVTMDADYGLFALFHSSQHPPGFNGAFYSNPTVDALLEAARSTLNLAEREAAYADAIAAIWEDAPWLFLYSETQVTAVRSNVTGFVVHPDESLIATGADKN